MFMHFLLSALSNLLSLLRDNATNTTLNLLSIIITVWAIKKGCGSQKGDQAISKGDSETAKLATFRPESSSQESY